MRSAGGRPVAVEITTPLPLLEVGFRFRVLGDELRRPHGFGWTGHTDARPPTPQEAQEALRPVGSHRARQEHPPEVKERALLLVDAGLSQHEVSREVGVPRPTIGMWVQRRNAVA